MDTFELIRSLQETAKLEAEAYVLEQKTALAAEAKSVLDSWVRYESQVKQRQQKELAESIIAKVQKELENPKTLQQILQQSVAEVESEYPYGDIPTKRKLIKKRRNCLLQGSINAYTRPATQNFLAVPLFIHSVN